MSEPETRQREELSKAFEEARKVYASLIASRGGARVIASPGDVEEQLSAATEALREAEERLATPDTATAPITRVTVNLPTAALERLRALASARGDSLTQALKDAIAVKLALEEERSAGSRILVRRPDGSQVELLIP